MLTLGLREIWLALTQTEWAGFWPLWGGGARKGRVCDLSEERTQGAVSTPTLLNPAAEAAVSLLGGAADREETFDPARSLTAACGLQSPPQTAFRYKRCIDVP